MPEVLRWGAAAAKAFGYPPPSEDWAAALLRRLPDGLLASLALGVQDGLLVAEDHQFRLARGGAGKGPYSWFSRSASAQPAPNWEYFVQVAVWLEVARTVPTDTVVGFEDELMDVSVRGRDGSVLWCVEVKERADQLPALVQAVRRHGGQVDLEAPDRGDDPLRKAKYLVRQRPKWFSAVAVGARYDFSVAMDSGDSFRLEPDVVPVALPGRATDVA